MSFSNKSKYHGIFLHQDNKLQIKSKELINTAYKNKRLINTTNKITKD